MTIDVGKSNKIIVTGPAATTPDDTVKVNKANAYVVAKPISVRVVNKMNTYIVVGPPPADDKKKRRTVSVWMG